MFSLIDDDIVSDRWLGIAAEVYERLAPLYR